jgi:pectate lyase
MGACVRVEKNYFLNAKPAVTSEFSSSRGMVQLIDNIFVNSTHITEPVCDLDIPYDYEHLLDEPSELPMMLAGDVVGIDDMRQLPLDFEINSYPNPFNPEVNIVFTLPKSAHVQLDICNALGQKIAQLADKRYRQGRYILKWNAADHASGIYFYRIKTEYYFKTKKMILLK